MKRILRMVLWITVLILSLVAFQNGGYSTDISHYAAGTGEALAEHFVEMLQGLRG